MFEVPVAAVDEYFKQAIESDAKKNFKVVHDSFDGDNSGDEDVESETRTYSSIIGGVAVGVGIVYILPFNGMTSSCRSSSDDTRSCRSSSDRSKLFKKERA
mmetsp:Transcript_24914/g.31368  ORF Transcript_24914/g.31368 Transcript_24914/m.31368 type:complete len:101 (-) Transcript_24914:172-474(-)